MKKTSVAFALIAGLLLSGCEKDPVISKTEKWYEVTEVKQPKRFKVSLRDDAGNEYPMLYVSKRCSSWGKLRIGSRWLFVEVLYQGKKGIYAEIEGISSLCSKLQAM